jgi:3-hydroxyacyl-[acyl-carrier-protein] dehydratase
MSSQTFTPPEPLELEAAPGAVPSFRLPIGSDEIRRILPHSWPFLHLDRVTELTAEGRGVGLKNVSVAEPHFAGHFPHESIVPGVLIVESLAQLAGIVVAVAPSLRVGRGGAAAGRPSGQRAFLAGIKRMRFRHPARPGDQVRLQVTLSAESGAVSEFQAEARVGSWVVANGSLTIAT